MEKFLYDLVFWIGIGSIIGIVVKIVFGFFTYENVEINNYNKNFDVVHKYDPKSGMGSIFLKKK